MISDEKLYWLLVWWAWKTFDAFLFDTHISYYDMEI